MSVREWFVAYGIGLVVFLALDFVWLSLVAKQLYAGIMGRLLADEPRLGVAGAFYALWVVGLVHFAIRPAMESGSLGSALVNGALYGLFTYATFDLTSLAVLKDYPARIVPIDMAWGTALATAVSGASFAITRALFS
jgi:uncharacterized membrane protein